MTKRITLFESQGYDDDIQKSPEDCVGYCLIPSESITTVAALPGWPKGLSGLPFNSASTPPALDNSSEIFAFGVFNASSQNPFNIGDAEKSYSGFDRRQAGSINAIWDLPFYKDQKGILGRVLGGWQIKIIVCLMRRIQ